MADEQVDGGDDAPWCVVANVTREPHPEPGRDGDQLGTKHFAPGAKVHIFRTGWGDGGEKLIAIGRHRGTSRHVRLCMASKWLENFRAKPIHHPAVREMSRDVPLAWTRGEAEEYAATCVGRAI